MKTFWLQSRLILLLTAVLCVVAVTGALAAPAAAPAPAATPAPVATPPAPPTFPAVMTLTPAAAADLAEQEALEIKQAREGIVQAKAGVDQAQVGYHLQAGVTVVEGRDGPVDTFTFGSSTVTIGSPLVRQATIAVTQPLYTGGRVEAQVAAARAGVGAATAQTDATIRSLRLGAETAAYAALRARELADVAAQTVAANQEHLRLAQLMFTAGTIAQFEVVQAQTQLSSAEGQQVAADTAVDQALASLRRILSLPQTQNLQVQPPASAAIRPGGELSDLIQAGWNNRPEIRALQAEVDAAEANLRLAKATDNLSASLGGEYQHNGSAAGLVTSENSWQVAVTLTKPILDGGLRKSLVEGAASRVRSAQLSLDTERQQIALTVNQALLASNQALKQLQVATQGVIEAREAARIAEVRFSSGVGTGLEVIDAQTALAAAQAAQVNASHDLQLALIQLRDAMGQPLEGGTTP